MTSLPLHDPDFYLGDVQSVYARLRAEAPVYWSEAAGMFALSKYADIQRVSKDPALFCSRRGVMVNDPLRLVGDMPTPPSIIHMDPPGHNRYRKLVSGAFTPRMIAMLEARIRDLVRETLDAVPADDVFDFVEHVAVPIPIHVIAEMLGVPTSDRATFRRWSDAVIAGADADAAALHLSEVAELFAFFQTMLESRRAEPKTDLLSALAVGVVDGERLSDEEILMFCMTLLVAGNETTRTLVAGGTRALLEHPDQLRRLRDEPAVLPSAIEEMLRWVTPIRSFCRTATRDTEIRGTAIPEGAPVILFYASANRDEEVFGPTAGEFHIDRPLEPAHLSFGVGEHFCLGASLARLEARLMFEGILSRWSRMESAGPAEQLRSTLMNGLVRLPLRVRP